MVSRRPPLDPWLRGRVLHFVRHGHYDNGESGTGNLTPRGEQQSVLLARHFSSLPIDSVISSDTPRAVQTAQIVAEALGVHLGRRHRLLREALPTTVPGERIPLAKRIDGSARLERIVEQFFRPSRSTRHEVVICHGNLIRALFLRVVSGRPHGWYRLLIHHAGITSFRIVPSSVTVLSYDAQQHIPSRLRSHL